jgi:malonyl-CoA/methylmalonyl-CoA synthetase
LVVAALVSETALNTTKLAAWLKERIPPYKIPRQFIQLDDLPRNAMGKVTKNELKKHFTS